MTLRIHPQSEILSPAQEKVLKTLYNANPEPLRGGGYQVKVKLRSSATQIIAEILQLLNDTGSPVKINRSCT